MVGKHKMLFNTSVAFPRFKNYGLTGMELKEKYFLTYPGPGEGNGNSLQHSCLENLTDRGTWWAVVHGVAKSWT